MGLQKFLSLLSAGIGLVGAIFLAKSFLGLTPNDILHLTSPYSKIAFAPEQISSMSVQKANAIIGIFFILSAFIGQICALVLVDESTTFVSSRWIGFWMAAVYVSVFTLLFSFINLKLSNYIKLETGKIAIRDYCNKRFMRDKIDPVNLEGFKTMAHELMSLSKRADESNSDFIKRIFDCIGLKYLDNPDFTKSINEMKEE
jgi:hypothetical protein